MKKLEFVVVACLVILLGTISCEKDNLRKNPKIVIIGAGPSGIAAASKLFENGFTNVTILEAEERIGGRVYTTKLGNYSVDLGGQWVHGEKGNIAYELAKPFGLFDEKDSHSSGVFHESYDSQGNLLSPELSKTIQDFLHENAFDVSLDADAPYESVGEYAEKKFAEIFKNNTEILAEKEKYLRQMELVAIAEDSADSWYNVSAKDECHFINYPGNYATNWKERGFSTILDILMKRYPNPENELPVINNTVLNTEVTSIDYSNDVEDGPSVLITTANGQIYKADHVIVTVSLGVLKEKHKSLFIPPLPDYKVKFIEGVGFGNAAKIYLLFNEPFWNIGDKQMIVYDFFWNDANKKEIEADPEKRWLLGNYQAITVEHKPNLLTFWTTSNHSREMESLPEEKVFKHVVENLHRFLGKQYNITDPIAMLRTRWYSNPHFRGLYSYRSTEAHKQKLLPEMLERPLKPETLALLFAGEATSTKRFSTVDGAIGSGWKAANRLIDHYKEVN